MVKQTINAFFGAVLGCVIAAAPAAAELLQFVQAAPAPFGQSASVVVSPDGAHVYVAAGSAHALVAYSRDQASGELTEIQTVTGITGLLYAGSITISPDGLSVYSTSPGDIGGTVESAVVVFSRNIATGELTYVEAEFEGVNGVQGLEAAHLATVSPDGKHVYVAAPGDAGGTPPIPGRVSLFERDATTGELTFINVVEDGAAGVEGLGGVLGVVISPDGTQAYTAAYGDDAVAVFDRDVVTGDLSFVEVHVDGISGVDGLDGANELAISTDGANVYAVSLKRSPTSSDGENALVTFSRDTTTGALTYTDVQRDGVAGVEGLSTPSSVVLDPSDRLIFVAGFNANALVIFTRDGVTGLPTYFETELDGLNDVDGLGNARWAELSPDGSHIYVAGLNDAVMAVFALPVSATIPVIGLWGLVCLGGLLASMAVFVRR
ncbi:MAG: lactonase family protein [Gammaproteobacteria bacterium]|nr:lactonase family protein [Gammaproteobacteria bacterium]NNM10720.1 beta-propeller fold lactonase family protein [Pseudomonadales bacterium]